MKKIILLLTLITLSHAEIVLEPMQVTANNYAQTIDATTENTLIITAEMLKLHQVNTLSEALSRLANISVVSNGGYGQTTSVMLRGFDSKRLLVLIDGVRANDITGLNGTTFQHLLMSDIERIEIIKGAQSGIWGADASAGVINIITTKAKKGFHTTIHAAYGSYNTTEAMLALSYKAKLFNIKFSADSLGSDGFSAAEPKFGDSNYGTKGDAAGFEKDAYSNQSYQAALGLHLSDKDQLKLNIKQILAYVEYDAAAGVDAQNVDDPYGFGASNYFNNTQQTFYQSNYKHGGKNNDITLQANLSTFDRDQYGGYIGSLAEYSFKDLWRYTTTDSLQFGWDQKDFNQEKAGGTDLNKGYSNQAVYFSNNNQFGNFIMSEALRIDQFDTFENKTTGKFGLKYRLGDAYVSLNAGTAYNVPTLYQLYGDWVGNSALIPESTSSIDLKTAHKGITIGYFYNEIDNLIDYNSITSQYENISGISILQGLEFGYKKMFHALADLNFDYTYLHAKNGEGKLLARRPNHQANLNITSYFTPKTSSIVTVQYVGTRYNDLDSQGAQTGEYALVHLTANYELDTYKYFIKIDNLFNTFYQEVDGYQTPGLSFKMGLNASF